MKVAERIQKAIKEASTRNLTQGFIHKIIFKGKEYELKLSRRFEKRGVGVCNRTTCNAGKDCTHLTKVDGIELCVYGTSRWDVMDGELGVIFSDMECAKEDRVWEMIRRFLLIIERMDKVT